MCYRLYCVFFLERSFAMEAEGVLVLLHRNNRFIILVESMNILDVILIYTYIKLVEYPVFARSDF